MRTEYIEVLIKFKKIQKMKYLKYIIHYTLYIFLLASCNQKFEPKPLTYTQILTGTEKKTWVLVSAKIFDEGNASPDIKGTDLLSACALDDQFIFYANDEKKMEYTNGPTKCRTTEPDILVTDTWEIQQGIAELDIAIPRLFGGAKLPFVIKSLTATDMTLEYYFGDIDASYRFAFTSSTK